MKMTFRISGLPGHQKASTQNLRFAVVVWQRLNADVRVAGWYVTKERAVAAAAALKSSDPHTTVVVNHAYRHA